VGYGTNRSASARPLPTLHSSLVMTSREQPWPSSQGSSYATRFSTTQCHIGEIHEKGKANVMKISRVVSAGFLLSQESQAMIEVLWIL